ncbi:MAG: hypothetical protein ACM31C_23005 [Acidobacteriota bacterium]
MLPCLSRGLRLALILGLSTSYIAWHTRDAFAKKHQSDDDSDDSDDDSDDSDDSGGKDDSGGDDSGDDSDSDSDKDQPPVTAGGLYTINTYPVRELERPLTITKGVTQLRLGLGTDLSAKGAFDSVGASIEGVYGLKDNFELIGGLTSAYNFNQFNFYAGFEGSLVYDVVDIRLAANVHRNAVPAVNANPDDVNSELVPGYGNFCNPPTTPGEQITPSHGMCGNPMASIDPLPTGKYIAGGTQFSLDLGFPFRYSFTPEVAIVALQTLISIDFNGVGTALSCSNPAKYDTCHYDHIEIDQLQCDPTMDPTCNAMTMTKNVAVPRGNSAKPDLDPSIGLATNPIPALSIVAFAQLRVPDFDTAAGAFQIPVTLRGEFSPNRKFDIGLEFTLLNVKPPDPQSPLDNRFLSTYMQARF